MAGYFVAADAAGGGNGSEANPWTWDEMAAAAPTFVASDIVTIGTGTHSATASVAIPAISYFTLRGSYASERPVVNFSPSPAYAIGTTTNTRSALFENLEINIPGGLVLSGSLSFDNKLRRVKSSSGVTHHPDRPVSYDLCEFVNGEIGTNAREINDSFINDFDNVRNHGTISKSVVFGSSLVLNVGRNGVLNTLTNGTVRFEPTNLSPNGTASNCIVYNAATPVSSASKNGELRGCIFIACGPLLVSSDVRYVDCIETAVDPFIDGANRDYRLTEPAKSAAYAPQLKAILASLVDVPGITLDPLSELIGGASTPRILSPFLIGDAG